MALDVGDRRIGVALSDPTGLIASPLLTIHRSAERKDHARVHDLILAHGVGLLVVGLPQTLRGEIGSQAQRVLSFAERLEEVIPISIVFWDERHSTVDAERIVRSGGGRANRRGAAVDDVAAAVILQSYLDSHPSSDDTLQTPQL